MRFVARLRSFLRAVLFRHRMERDMEQEWRFHLDARIDDLVATGLSRTDAATRARFEFGDPLRWKEYGREALGLQFFDELRQDAVYATRQLAAAPLFTLVAVVTLALGIGANTAIFSVINAVLLRPLPFTDSDQLVRFIENFPAPRGSSGPPLRVPGMDLTELATLHAQTQTLSYVAAFSGTTMMLTRDSDTIRVEGAQVSPDAFPMLGARALLGRTFEPREATATATGVVVLSYGAWQRLFGGDPHILGRVLTLDGTGRSVVGVMPRGFGFPEAQTEFLVPFVPPTLPPGLRASRPAIARIKPSVTRQAAAAEVNSLLIHVPEGRQLSSSADSAQPPRFELVGVQDMLVGPVRPALLVIAAAVGFVLLIACVNVANLLLARMAARHREMAVRVALGAGRSRLVRQVLTESLLLALAAGVAGTGLAYGGVRVLRSLGTGLARRDLGPSMSLPRLDEVSIDGSVYAFALAVAILTAVLFGLAPAIRLSSQRSMAALRESAGSGASGFDVFHRVRMQSVLVIAQIAMALTLSIGGGLLVRSFAKLSNVDPGYDLTDVLTFQVTFPKGRYSAPQYASVAEETSARLQSAPGLRSSGYTLVLPIVSGRAGQPLRLTREPPAEPPPLLAAVSPERPLLSAVSREFLNVLGIRLIAGRGFGDNDRAGQPPVMLIDRTVARSGFLGEHPIGKYVYGFGTAPIEVIGVVDNIRQLGLEQEPIAQVFVDLRQFPPLPRIVENSPPIYYAVRTDSGSSSVESIRAIVRQLDLHATVDNVATMSQLVSNSIARPRLYAVLLGLFAAVAVLLAAIGIYGVMTYSVARRTREIGIRMALGAARADVIGLVVRQSLTLTSVGITLGLVAAVAVTRYLDGLLFGLTPLDPTTFIAVAVTFACVATLAASVPARRATRVDPLFALRYE
jgi:putative ABC transport system permease protein